MNALLTYAQEENLESIFKSMMTRCFRNKSRSPIECILDFIEEKHPEALSARIGEPTVSSITPSVGGAQVTITHPSGTALQYLNDALGLSTLFENIANELWSEEPEDPVQFTMDLLRAVKEEREGLERERKGSAGSKRGVGSPEESSRREASLPPAPSAPAPGTAAVTTGAKGGAERRSAMAERENSPNERVAEVYGEGIRRARPRARSGSIDTLLPESVLNPILFNASEASLNSTGRARRHSKPLQEKLHIALSTSRTASLASASGTLAGSAGDLPATTTDNLRTALKMDLPAAPAGSAGGLPAATADNLRIALKSTPHRQLFLDSRHTPPPPPAPAPEPPGEAGPPPPAGLQQVRGLVSTWRARGPSDLPPASM